MAVMGAGSIGTYFGGWLAAAADVTLIGRAPTVVERDAFVDALTGGATLEDLVADLIATAVIFGFSRAYRNSSVYDAYWSVIPPLLALWWMHSHTGMSGDEIRGKGKGFVLAKPEWKRMKLMLGGK